jgi:hypothetical protein
MCTQVRCRQCGKPTWAGCGRHIEAALANVPVSERCRCREEAKDTQPMPRKRWFGLW